MLHLDDLNFAPDRHERQQLFAYVISAKRYGLLNISADGRPVLRKSSEHGLGLYVNPIDPENAEIDWIDHVWTMMIAEDCLGQTVPRPAWFGNPAISRIDDQFPDIASAIQRRESRQTVPRPDQTL